MYYDELLIDGVLHCRSMPNEPWRPISVKGLTVIIVQLRKELAEEKARNINEPIFDDEGYE